MITLRLARREPAAARDELLDDYVAAEDALRAFTDRNFGRMCAICARWTLYAARINEEAQAMVTPAAESAPVSWRLQSWVTNCCNANHALESMSEASLAGIVASREEGQAWWQKVKRSHAAPCAALTDQGCALKRGRPELCNRYFCEAVRDYLWMLGGERVGADLAGRLDDLQRRWAHLYRDYQDALHDTDPERNGEPADDDGETSTSRPGASRRHVRDHSEWTEFFAHLEAFDRAIAHCVRPVTAQQLAGRLFKVDGDRSLYEPFFERETQAIDGQIRSPKA